MENPEEPNFLFQIIQLPKKIPVNCITIVIPILRANLDKVY